MMDSEYIFLVIFPTTFLIMVIISKYMPVKDACKEDFFILGPTNVSIERTDDVNENIRRYKKALNEAIDKKRKKKLG